MFRSAKNVNFNNHFTSRYDYHATTFGCSSMLIRLSITSLVLLMNLVHCFPPEDPREYYGPRNHHDVYRHTEPRRSFSQFQKDNFGPRDSDFSLNSPDFEVNLEIHHGDKGGRINPNFGHPNHGYNDDDHADPYVFKSDKELVERAYREGILRKPDDFGAGNGEPGTDSDRGINQAGRFGNNDVEMPPPETFIPKISPECESSTMCRSVESYPEEYINRLIADSKELKLFTGVDSGPGAGIISRIGGEDGGSLCQSDQQTWFPTSIRSSPTDNWLWVVNVPDLKQGFLIDRCSNPDNACRKVGSLTDNLESGYSAVCKQQQGLRKVVVLSRDNGTIMIDSFPIDTGCCCHIDSVASRFGGADRNSVHPFSSFHGHRRSAKLH